MISVVIPTLNAESHLPRTLGALIPAAVDGLICEVIVADGGSTDATAVIADAAGATLIAAERGRGPQLIAGAAAARGRWLLFLHADTMLQTSWEREAWRLMQSAEANPARERAGVFRFALDDSGVFARCLEGAVRLRCAVLRMPYGDQGLLISRRLYDKLGGFRPLALMEDVDIVRRLGRGRIALLRADALTSAGRYRSEGYGRRVLRNAACLALYYLRVPPRYIVRLYG